MERGGIFFICHSSRRRRGRVSQSRKTENRNQGIEWFFCYAVVCFSRDFSIRCVYNYRMIGLVNDGGLMVVVIGFFLYLFHSYNIFSLFVCESVAVCLCVCVFNRLIYYGEIYLCNRKNGKNESSII